MATRLKPHYLKWNHLDKTLVSLLTKSKGRSKVEYFEELMVRIQSRQIDWDRTIGRKLTSLEKTRAYFENDGDPSKAPLPEVEPPRQTPR